jgi:hypothetical protein
MQHPEHIIIAAHARLETAGGQYLLMAELAPWASALGLLTPRDGSDLRSFFHHHHAPQFSSVCINNGAYSHLVVMHSD